MRPALLCVFFVLIIRKEGSHATSSSDFRPIPIPLDHWNYEKRESRVDTSQENISTENASSAVSVPPHYWEDALRHSVYLTLVRDKIDLLIAKGFVVSPDSKLDDSGSREINDHDLWEKIKSAPFDRIEDDEDQQSLGDITIMAKGRLVEENGSYRFTQDKRSKENCTEENCTDGVKAFWSVKRIRQRDEGTSPGRYHYELTFAVTSQKPKKQKKQHENNVRTFTVRETPPEIIVAPPQEQPYYQTTRPPVNRPQRALWFHRNIAPAPSHSQARYHHQGLERIFSAFFSDDDPVEPPPQRYKPNHYVPPMYSQFSKLGYVGQASDQHQHKKFMPYPHKPNMYKYRPPLQAPPLNHAQHHYMDTDAIIHNPYGPPPPDHRYISPSNIVKTTRPAVLPTPPITGNITPNNISLDIIPNEQKENVSEIITKEPEILTLHKPHHKPRLTQTKIKYFPEHIRPPIYNAPPGVFVDKKPFKPMPPLKFMHPTKNFKRPIDFRPSPQIDVLLSNQESVIDSAFRPILVNFTDTEDKEKTGQKQDQKQVRTKKPPKKHENIKSQRLTTSAPDIITINNDLDYYNESVEWANLLSAFTKTTPMEPQTEKQKESETTVEPTTPPNSTPKYKTTTESSEEITTASTTTTAAPKKRTRPPHKFARPDKIKKHKRITTTTKAPESATNKKNSDLTPQASSAATTGNKGWHPKNKTTTTIATTTTTTTSTTSRPTASTQSPTTTQVVSTTSNLPSSTSQQIETTIKPVHEKSKNRFRQSTLMLKGTSVKHDRWSVNSNPEKKLTAATSVKHPPRRKGSNFHGYGPSKHSAHDDEHDEQSHTTHVTELSKRQESDTAAYSQNVPLSTQPTYEQAVDHYNINSESTSEYSQSQEEDEETNDDIKVKNDHEQELVDHAEYIFDLSSTTPSDKTNEINEEESTVTELSVVATSHSVSRNKTRCKKKKHHHLTPTMESINDEVEPTSTTTIASTTKSSSGLDILDELLGSLTYQSTTAPKEPKHTELEEEGSENHEKYLNIDEDFDDFLDTLEDRNRHPDEVEKEEEEYEDDEKEHSIDDDEVSPFDNDDVNESSRNTSDKEYDDYHERSYSLLELMAME